MGRGESEAEEKGANATGEGCRAVTPSGLESHARDGLDRAELRSSIRASQVGMAEGLFSYEVGTAQHNRPSLTNNKRWAEVGISEVTQPTKHTLCVL
jgi:hypothetical protein